MLRGDLRGVEVVGRGAWWSQGPAVHVSEEAGRVVVPRNRRGVFALAARSGGELASGGACGAYRHALRAS